MDLILAYIYILMSSKMSSTSFCTTYLMYYYCFWRLEVLKPVPVLENLLDITKFKLITTYIITHSIAYTITSITCNNTFEPSHRLNQCEEKQRKEYYFGHVNLNLGRLIQIMVYTTDNYIHV